MIGIVNIEFNIISNKLSYLIYNFKILKIYIMNEIVDNILSCL